MSETEGTPEEKAPTDVAEYKTRIAKADGTLIPLGRESNQGTRLFIASRYIANPTVEDSPDAEKFFGGWERDDIGIGAFTGVMLVDVYTKEDGQITPVGHMDWWLQGDYANGGGNEHSAAIPRNDVEQRALDRWGGRFNSRDDNTAFKVDPEYQKQQLGSLMLATSGAVLPALGIAGFYSGVLLDPAESTYAHFGITPDDFRAARTRVEPRWKTQQLPIERLASSPHVDEVITHFLQPQVPDLAQPAA